MRPFVDKLHVAKRRFWYGYKACGEYCRYKQQRNGIAAQDFAHDMLLFVCKGMVSGLKVRLLCKNNVSFLIQASL